MSAFDVSRIVPSTRDLLSAIHTRRDGLALVCRIAPEGEDAIRTEVGRLDGLDVRAFAVDEPGEAARTVATSTSSTPCLSLSMANSAEACQRARFFGADGVGVVFGVEPPLEKVAQSMRLMALGFAESASEAERAVSAGARAVLFVGSLDEALATGEAVAAPTLVIARIADVDAAGLRRLSGKVDAAVVPTAVHRDPGFEALLEELDT